MGVKYSLATMSFAITYSYFYIPWISKLEFELGIIQVLRYPF